MKKTGFSKPRVSPKFDPMVGAHFRKFGRLPMKLRPETWPVPLRFDQSDLPDEISGPVADPPERGRRRRELQTSRSALVETVFDASTTPEDRRALLQGRGIAVVVTVPNQSWVQPVKGYLSELRAAEFFAREGSERKSNPAEDAENVASSLARGHTVIGISQSPQRLLPQLLVGSADLEIHIVSPTPETIGKAMGKCLRGRVPALPEDLGKGLEFGELIAALRNGSKPAQAVARLQAARRTRTNNALGGSLPALEEAVFYGAAREWGLSLAADVAAAKNGETEWTNVDRGACFYGPPGTGKSWLAAMIAAACDLPIISSSVADLFATSAGYLDSVIKAQRQVFARALAMAPCVLFWDEIDGLPNRSTISPRGRDWWLPVIEDFLCQLSALPPGIITLAATNQSPKDLDDALLRPGRLERAILVEPPETAEGLAGILRFHLGVDLVGTDLVPLARLGLGATAAEAMEWVRAARRTARRSGRKVTADDLLAAIAPPETRTPEALFLAAVHEAGHAVAAIVIGSEPIQHLSLIQKRGTGGSLRLGVGIDLEVCARDDIEKYVIVALAARAAEIMMFEEASAGCSGAPDSDLGLATRLVASIHVTFGLGESLIYRANPDRIMKVLAADRQLRERVEQDLQRLQRLATELVRTNRRAVEKIAEALMVRRFMTGEEVRQVFEAACRSPAVVTHEADASMPIESKTA